MKWLSVLAVVFCLAMVGELFASNSAKSCLRCPEKVVCPAVKVVPVVVVQRKKVFTRLCVAGECRIPHPIAKVVKKVVVKKVTKNVVVKKKVETQTVYRGRWIHRPGRVGAQRFFHRLRCRLRR